MWEGDGEEKEGYKERRGLYLCFKKREYHEKGRRCGGMGKKERIQRRTGFGFDLELFFMPVFEFLCCFVNMLLGRSDAR